VNTINQSVLFLPGTLCDERIWLPIWQTLNIHERLYSPLQWAQSLEDMLALTEDRISQAQGKVHLVGYSMGGYIAALSALQNKSEIASISLIAYDPFGLSNEELSTRQSLLKALSKNPKMKLGRNRLAQYFTQAELDHNTHAQTVIDMQNDLGNATLVNQIKATTPRQDLSTQLQSLDIPMQAIVGKQDFIARANNVEKFCQSKPSANLHCLSDTAHMLVLTQANKVSDMLAQFISANSN
jgi:pimeloyl-ACP methyl ester carboxylesterase